MVLIKYVGRHQAKEIREVPEDKVDWFLSTNEWIIYSEVKENANERKHAKQKTNEKRHE